MTPTEVMEQIAQHDLHWYERFLEEKPWESYYLLIAEIGRDMTDDMVARQDLERVYKVFCCVEKMLNQLNADDHLDAISLIGAGLLESMHSKLMLPRDFLDQFMGETTLNSWRGSLEGWYGVRSLSAYERILVNRPLTRIEIEWCNANTRLVIDSHTNETAPQTERIYSQPTQVIHKEWLTPERSERVLNFFGVLLAEKSLGFVSEVDSRAMGFEAPYAILKINMFTEYKEITVGNPVGEIIPQRYIVTNQDRIYTLADTWEGILQV